MKHTMQYSVGGQTIDVSRDRNEEFLNDVKANGDTAEEIKTFRVKSKDWTMQTVPVRLGRFDEFSRDAEANGDSIQEMHSIAMDDGSRMSIADNDAFFLADQARKGNAISRKAWQQAGLPREFGDSQEKRNKFAFDLGNTLYGEHFAQVDADNAKRKDLGVLGTRAAQLSQELGREVGSGEAALRSTPFVGTAMNVIEKGNEYKEQRLFNGDFQNPLEAAVVAKNAGYPQERIDAINERANAAYQESLDTDLDGKVAEQKRMEVLRAGYRDLAKDAITRRIVARQQAGEKLSNNDLNWLQEAGVGAIGAAQSIAEMANPVAGAATAGMGAMNRAGTMGVDRMNMDEEGNVVTEQKGDENALLKGAASSVAERVIWGGGAKKLLGTTKWGKKLVDAVDGAVGKAATKGGAVARNAAELEGMVLKSRFTELVDEVAGANVRSGDKGESFKDWAVKFLNPVENVKTAIELLPMHGAFKAMHWAKGKFDGSEAQMQKMRADLTERGVSEETMKSLNDADLANIYRMMRVPQMTEERIGKFVDDVAKDAKADVNKLKAVQEIAKSKSEGKPSELTKEQAARVDEVVGNFVQDDAAKKVVRDAVADEIRRDPTLAEDPERLEKSVMTAAEKMNAPAEEPAKSAEAVEKRVAEKPAEKSLGEKTVEQKMEGREAQIAKKENEQAANVVDGKTSEAPKATEGSVEAPKAEKPVSAAPEKVAVAENATTTPKANETPEQFRERVKDDPVLKRIDAEMKKAKTDAERNALKDQFSKRLDDLRLAEKVDADRMEKLSTSKEVLEFAKKNGRAVVDGKVSPGTVNDYLKDQVKKAKDATKRLFNDADVEVKYREYDEELDEGMVKLKSVKLSSSGIDVRDASAAIENQKGVIKNRITGIDAVLSSNGAGKLVSNAAVSKSVANGFTKRQHNEMASRIKELFEEAALIESRPDKNGDVNVKSIKRFVTPVELEGLKGDTACAYITVKESTEHGHRIYSIEEIKLTALPEKVRRVISDRNSAGNAVTEYSIAKGSFGVNSTLTLRSSNGRVVGTFDPTTKKVTLYRGADEKTVYHELIGHGVEDWAKRNNKPLHDKLMRLANEAPESIRKEIEKKYPGADAATVAKEIVAKFAELKGGKNIRLKDAPKNWIARTYVAVRDAIIGFIENIGGNRIDLGKIERMSPVEVMDYLTKEIGKGKTLGEIGSGKNGGKMGVGEKWANAIFDRHTSLYKVSKEAGDAKSLQPGREAEFQVLKFNPKKDGYAKLLKEGGVAHEEVAEYMKAVAAKERNAADGWESSGLSDERIAQTLRHFENHPRAEEIKKAADFLWKMQEEGMQERIRAGLVSESEYKAWKEREEHHVPFRSAVDENGDFVAWNSGRGIAKGEFEQHEGRFTESGDPIAWMFEEYADAHLRAIENDTRVALARAVEANPSLGKISTDPSLKELRVKGGEGSPNVVKFKEIGKDGNAVARSIVLNGERGAAAASSYTNRDLKTMWSPLRRFMRFWSSTATEWSPTFGLRNTIKDNTDLALLALSEKGVKEGSKWIKDYSKERTATAKEVWEYARTGNVKPGSAVDRYIKAGGLIGGFEREGYGDIKEQFSYDRIRKEMSGGANRYKRLGENTVGVIKAFNSWAELGTRIAAFEVNVKDGMSPKDAALWSRRATVDFNRKGNLTPITNTLFMFSNSVLGAKVRQLEAVKTGMKTPAGRRALGAILLAGVGEAIAEHFMNQDDDERGKRGEATGKDITEFSRKNNFYLRFGGRMVNLGVHDDVLAQIKYYGNAVTRLALGDIDAKTVGKEVFGDAVANIASFVGMGAPSVDAGISGFLPTLAQPVAQDLSNKNYMGSPIRRQKYNDAQPDSSNGRKSTGEAYKWIAESLNEWTGGNKGRAGAVDVAPETLKHYWESVFKNTGKDAENMVMSIARAMTGEYGQKDTNTTPGVRDVTRFYDSNDNRYFDHVRRFKEDEKELADMKSTWSAEERREYMEKHPWLRKSGTTSPRVKQLQTQINELRRKEGGEVKLKGGKWVPRDISEDRVKELTEKRRKLQAKVIELMTPKKR